MRNRKAFTVLEAIIVLVLLLFPTICWVANIVKLCHCDFKAPYKGEVIHGVGVVCPPAAMVTVWFDDK